MSIHTRGTLTQDSLAANLSDKAEAVFVAMIDGHYCFMCKKECDCGGIECWGCRRCVVDGPPE